MTEETQQVEQLDYSKPPPGYEGQALEGAIGVNEAGEPYVAAPRQYSVVPPLPTLKVGRDFNWHLKPSDAIAEAWAHYKARHDPPGVRLSTRPGNRGYFLRIDEPDDAVLVDVGNVLSDARAAAWAWYDRRLGLVDKLIDEDVRRVIWPRCLTWSDDQVAEVERWLVDFAVLPEVLRG